MTHPLSVQAGKAPISLTAKKMLLTLHSEYHIYFNLSYIEAYVQGMHPF